MSSNEYKCTECTKIYTSYMGLWKHKKLKHTLDNPEPIIIKPEIENNRLCKYCKKEYSNSKNRWRHEKYYCKSNTTTIPPQQANIINNTQNNTTIQTQNNTNIQTQNNVFNISFNKLGDEDLNILTQEEIEEIIDNGLNSIIKLIEFINFNKAHPQNHTFCTTNLNNNFASILNTETNEIETKPKVDIYDKVLYYALRHIKAVRNKIIDKKKRKIFKEKIAEIEQNIFGGEAKYKKIVIDQLKSLSYTKRNMVEKTWDKYIKEYISLII
jgi:hypothetical protein